jgi:hypothetical protein
MGQEGHVYQAPASADEFWRRDGGFIVSLTRKQLGPGVSQQDAEDAASEIFERLLVARNKDGQGILEQYSAGYTSARTGKPVTWRGFLSGKVALYVRGKRESIARRTGRELLLCDAAIGDGGERWVDLFGGQVWDDYPSLTTEEFTDRMRNYLATVPGTWDGPGSLFEVFNEIIERIKSGERATQVAGLSRKETARALVAIREVLAEAASKPPPGPLSVCGVVLSPAEARDALDRLRAAKGNHVHRALAGHRLMTEGPKGWYHQLAKAERKAFPDIELEASHGQVGGAGTGHVKEAVCHALTRMLAGTPAPEPEAPARPVLRVVPALKATAKPKPAPAPEPEEDVTRAELLEAELWHITGLDKDHILKIIQAAEKVYA